MKGKSSQLAGMSVVAIATTLAAHNPEMPCQGCLSGVSKWQETNLYCQSNIAACIPGHSNVLEWCSMTQWCPDISHDTRGLAEYQSQNTGTTARKAREKPRKLGRTLSWDPCSHCQQPWLRNMISDDITPLDSSGSLLPSPGHVPTTNRPIKGTKKEETGADIELYSLPL